MSSNAPLQHILILGSGVFGLSTLLELLTRESFSSTKLTLVSPTLPPSSSTSTSAESPTTPAFTAAQTASHDTTRIIRTDYADADYASLGAAAHALWRDAGAGWGSDGRYVQSGLVLTAERKSDPRAAEYVSAALANARELERREGVAASESKLTSLESADAVAGAMGSGGLAKGTGDVGYLNAGAGWADAGAVSSHLLQRILTHPSAKSRLTLHRATATRLLLAGDESPRISGAQLDVAPHSVSADMTILATGAWTPTLLDTRGVASARAQCSAYIPVSAAEAAALKDMPVHLNLASGCFVFPPTRTARRPGAATDGQGWEVKVARHAFGYAPPLVRARPVRADADGEVVHGVAHMRAPVFRDALPPTDEEQLRAFVAQTLPQLADVASSDRAVRAQRPWTGRLCYYLDTAAGDFIVARHPAFRSSLFVATGGSGHAFKFAPTLGGAVVDVLDGTDARRSGKERGRWTRKWSWPVRDPPLRRRDPGEVWCQDGSRAGVAGILLEDALKGDMSVRALEERLPVPKKPEEFDIVKATKSNL